MKIGDQGKSWDAQVVWKTDIDHIRQWKNSKHDSLLNLVCLWSGVNHRIIMVIVKSVHLI